MCTEIDTAFDFRTDTRRGKDPDTYSESLRIYHKLLWSKRLPEKDDGVFDLEYTKSPPYYLRHRSELGEFALSSDAVVPSFTRERRIPDVIGRMPGDELDTFNTLGYTIGGMMIWPANRIDRKMTINAARGCHPRIKDRFDLTVECIRRYYNDPSKRTKEHNPLGETLARYSAFFALFRDFRGFVEFFLLQDLVTDDFSAVRFMLPFGNEDDFLPWPLPTTREAYRSYKQKAMDFITRRNERILAACLSGP